MSQPKYKYTTVIEAEVIACKAGEDSLISLASLDNLSSLLPKDIDFKENVDLLLVAFNAAVVNKFNRNGDGIGSETAVRYNDNFIHKPTNIEHDKEKIVGHIVSAGFSDIETSKILSKEEVKDKKDPFNIALGAIVYKSANPAFAEALERSVDPEDGLYQKISTSWEIGFSDYVLAVGGDEVSSAKIIDSKEEINELKSSLRAYGGSGITNKGEKINRLIVGDIYPLGIGFTTNPAADVKGVYMNTPKEIALKIKDVEDKKISQKEKINVNAKKNNLMETQEIVSQLKELLVEKKFSDEAVASMTATFQNAIKEKDEQYRAELTQAQEEKAKIEQESQELKASVDQLKQQFAESQEKLAEFEAAQKAEQAIARFNERMELIDNKFELDEQDREFLAQDLKQVESTEEAFAAYSEKLEILWKHKNKEFKKELEEKAEARIQEEVEKRIAKQNVSTASSEEEVKSEEEILDNAQASEDSIPNSNKESSEQPKSLREKFAGAFNRDNIIIS